MPICIICREEFHSQSQWEPADPCLCGEMARAHSAWDWDRWRGVRKAVRYRIAGLFVRIADWFMRIADYIVCIRP